jgi:hypothetical protein
MRIRTSAVGSAYEKYRLCAMRVVAAGGNANNSGNTEAFYVNANNSPTNANPNIGSQLSLLTPCRLHISSPLGGTQSKPIGVGSSMRRLRVEISR